mmetsp:Transcript_9820/g.22680  ORF Transcript_9820/g.22680 Transcript_9820/m.22680 type:complete len:87 (+) Transcript_9820:529-789(+)
MLSSQLTSVPSILQTAYFAGLTNRSRNTTETPNLRSSHAQSRARFQAKWIINTVAKHEYTTDLGTCCYCCVKQEHHIHKYLEFAIK